MAHAYMVSRFCRADRFGVFERRQSRQAREREVKLWAQLEVEELRRGAAADILKPTPR
jgi:serine/threonine-protein kinase RIO1